MAEDIKDIAQMMGERFAEAVRLSEKADAEEIHSIIKSLDESYQIYVNNISGAQLQRQKLLEQIDVTYTREAEAAVFYQNLVLEIVHRLEIYEKAKLGNKVSDEAMAQRANGLGGIARP